MQSKQTQEKAWRQTYIIDKKQLESMSKDISKLFSFNLTVAPWADRISKMLAQSEQVQIKNSKQEKVVFQKLTDLGFDINNFREILKNYDQTHQSLVKIQNNSENILEKLELFRTKMGGSYEDLTETEEKLCEQLELLNKKIEYMGRQQVFQEQKENNKNDNKQVRVWQMQKRQIKAHSSPNKDLVQLRKIDILDKKMKDKQKEVEYIEKQIISLGKNLGWPQQDHKDFISIWHRGQTKNYFQIQEELQGYFAFYTAQQIQQHMNKYLKYKKLTQQKKEAIVQFKTLKEQKKIQQLRLLNLERDKDKEQKQRNQQKKRQQKQQLQMKSKISQWKDIKMKERQEQQNKKRLQQQQRRMEEQYRRRQLIDQNKQRVNQWKEKQDMKKDDLRRVQSSRKPPTLNKQTEERIRARQEQLILKKLEIVTQKRKMEQQIRQKEVKIKQEKYVKYSHVTNKLEHKTVAIKEKERQKFDGKDIKQANTFGGQLMMTGVRATPSWMKGI